LEAIGETRERRSMSYILTLFALIISGIGVWIAWEQKRIADAHLRHEQYDRKFRVYGSTKGLLGAFQADGRIAPSSFQHYLEGTADAEFLFDEDILDYLKQVRERAAQNIYNQRKLSSQNLPQKERNALIDKDAEDAKWFLAQFDIVRDLFKPTMQLSALPKRGRALRARRRR
jgi:hypothetical protein